MYSACLLTFVIGFLSLGLDVLWIRLFSYANYSIAQAFAFVMIWFFVGAAFGVKLGQWFCYQAYALFALGVCCVAGPMLYDQAVFTGWQMTVGAIAVMLSALLIAMLSPATYHMSVSTFSERIGHKVARLYAFNLLGAMLGPIFTGIVLLHHVTIQVAFIICAGCCFLMSLYCYVRSHR